MKHYIGIFGSAFDPPTLGHKDVIVQAARVCHEIILVPSACHAFMKTPLPFDHRMHLISAFINDIASINCRIYASDVEKNLLKSCPDKPVYTYNVMNCLEKLLLKKQPDMKLLFIRGPDNAAPATWCRFYRYKDIETRWSLFTAKERIFVRSSTVRKLLSNLPDKDILIRLEQYLTPSVCSEIIEHSHYSQDQKH